jgi:hypothetical protein
MWPAIENVTERSDMTRFLQTLDMCPIGLYVTRLLGARKLARYFSIYSRRVLLVFCLYGARF